MVRWPLKHINSNHEQR